MARVLIIDDEEPTREAIRILGDWQSLGVEEVLEAGDGRSGLELLRERKPDVVLVDMKMPEMDGLEFLRHVERDYPDLFTIVISGYNDFEFTRQAIRSRVVDYLLKPVNRADLNQALRKAFGVLQAKRESESEFISRNITLNMSLPKLKENIYQSIIERNFKAKTNEAYLRLIGADMPGHRFGAAVALILNQEKVSAERFKGETALLTFAASNVINEFAEEGFQSFSFANPKKPREIVVVHTMTGGYPDDIRFRSAHFMKKVVAALHDLLGVVLVAGIGTSDSDIARLAESYEAASAAAEGVDLLKLDGGTVAYPPANAAAAASKKEAPSIASRVPLIRAAIEAGHARQARTVVLDFTKKIRGLGEFTLAEAERMAGELLLRLNDAAEESGVPARRLPAASRDGLKEAGIEADYASFEEYEELLCRIVDYYADEMRAAAGGEKAFEIGEIKDYIDQHYFEDIKISMFTEKYYLSREYLMKLFKQQYGFGIHEYVQKVRMDKAKELLDDSELKIQEISEMLGYKDKNYFSKAFRNYFSLSPSEYRSSRAEGKK